MQRGNYSEVREQFYGSIREVFSWDWIDGDEYGLAGMHYITSEFRKEIAYATEELGRIYAKTVLMVQQSPEDLLEMLGIPQEAYTAIRLPIMPEIPTLIGRFDFANTPQGIKMLEFNADTPTSVVEAFYANSKACEFYGAGDPNQGLEQDLTKAFQEIVKRYQQLGYETQNIIFSSLDWHEEDRGTVQYLLKMSGLQGSFVPLKDLRVIEDELYALIEGEYQKVDIWYRLHALEKLAEEKDEDDYPTGAHVLDLIARGKLAIINPPAAFIAQTKAMQSLIWGLHEANEFYTEHEQEIIERYMLPTYMENPFLGKEAFVAKPIYGREGGAVSIFQPDGTVLEKDQEELYWEQPMIYQKYAEMEEIKCMTVKGPYKGRLLWGSFLIGGKASAVSARIGERITGNLSFFLPSGYRRLDL
ncbi:glutathionylspermidine synthase family protein [Desulfitobacterium sp.]|uniref:glutathionylspermidine synthase family protein n=1 Tax=Desulfitobacterium sp. TaxID=49981 RepID=UPI002B202EF9|nr:glutathionylspermidine synthase family protein [Desulfitobacterium sp.]MEA4900819.1 glutathionylspermidine synthase family protein [Desulfitobacterium sp.]